MGVSMATEDNFLSITDTQTRLWIFDTYVFGGIGIAASIMMLCSLTSIKKRHSYHYNAAINCNIASATCLLFYILFKLISNDLVFPITHSLVNHDLYTAIMATLFCVLWLIHKLLFYYGFTLLYVALFEKETIETKFKVMMVLLFVATMANGLAYLIDDILVDTAYDIGRTETYGIYLTNIFPDPAISIEIIASIALIIDLQYVTYLIYCFISESKRVGRGYPIAKKAGVLLSISSAVFIVVTIGTALDSDSKFLVDNVQLMVDSLCLFLMFTENEWIYSKMCCCLTPNQAKYEIAEIESDAVDTEEDVLQ